MVEPERGSGASAVDGQGLDMAGPGGGGERRRRERRRGQRGGRLGWKEWKGERDEGQAGGRRKSVPSHHETCRDTGARRLSRRPPPATVIRQSDCHLSCISPPPHSSSRPPQMPQIRAFQLQRALPSHISPTEPALGIPRYRALLRLSTPQVFPHAPSARDFCSAWYIRQEGNHTTSPQSPLALSEPGRLAILR